MNSKSDAIPINLLLEIGAADAWNTNLLALKRNSASLQWYSSDWLDRFLLTAGMQHTCLPKYRISQKTVSPSSSSPYWKTTIPTLSQNSTSYNHWKWLLIYFNTFSGRRDNSYSFQEEFLCPQNGCWTQK